MVGTGSSWAMIGGDANMKGFVPQNIVAAAGLQARWHRAVAGGTRPW